MKNSDIIGFFVADALFYEQKKAPTDWQMLLDVLFELFRIKIAS